MGVNKREYMEVHFVMDEEYFLQIPTEIREKAEIKHIEPINFDYQSVDTNGIWEKAKAESVKAYKKLKEIEFNLRNK